VTVAGSGLSVVPLTPGRLDDLATVFGTRGDASWCWCRFFVTTGRDAEKADVNQAALHAEVREASAPIGLIAYAGAEPVGWLRLGPREDYPRLAEAVPGASGRLWRVTCFVVRVGHRRRGVASALLDAGIGFAREQGADVLEGQPVDTAGERKPGASLFHGTLSLFAARGFTEVARPRPGRPVVRLEL